MHGFQGQGAAPPQQKPSTPGSRIKAARAYRGILQRDLEKQGVVTVSHLSKIEQGKRNILTVKAGTLTRLSEALGVTIDYIVKGEDEQQPSAA